MCCFLTRYIRTDAKGCKKFWGFSILVMDWRKVYQQKWSWINWKNAGYHYQIWKKGNEDDEKIGNCAVCTTLQETGYIGGCM